MLVDDQIHSIGFAHISLFLLQWFLHKKNNLERNFVYFCNNNLEFEIFLFVPFGFQKVNLLSKMLCIQSLTYNNNNNNKKEAFSYISTSTWLSITPQTHSIWDTGKSEGRWRHTTRWKAVECWIKPMFCYVLPVGFMGDRGETQSRAV